MSYHPYLWLRFGFVVTPFLTAAYVWHSVIA